MESSKSCIPIWEKFALTINEAVDYFGIGEKKLRKIVEENIDTGFVLQNGIKILIKRSQFEDYLNRITSI